MDDLQKRWLTTNDVARILRVSETRVRQLADEGKLPATRTLGGQRLFAERDVERLARDRETAAVGASTR